ncbi:MAG: hypothetical protein WAO90_11435 [Mycobacterium sp.]
MGVFIASEALAAGLISRYELAADYRRLLPGVYAPKRSALSTDDRVTAAWLWSRRRGVITGWAASALHGARWFDPGAPIEVNLDHNKSPAGVITRRDTLLDGEVTRVRGIPVTSVERTAFDLARGPSAGIAIQRLDALARATGFTAEQVTVVLDAHPRVRGRRRVAARLDLVDAGAQSPKETWLRLLLIQAGFPRPQTQIPVYAPDGYPRYFLDMGWERFMVAVEYDGEQHRTDAVQFRNDITRSEYVDGLGWRRIRVLAGDRRDEIVRRVERAGVLRTGR